VSVVSGSPAALAEVQAGAKIVFVTRLVDGENSTTFFVGKKEGETIREMIEDYETVEFGLQIVSRGADEPEDDAAALEPEPELESESESESASESEEAAKGDAADESGTEAAIPSRRRRRRVRQQRRVMRVVRRARLRASAERESTGVGQVEVGELVAVLGSAISSDGVERVVCDDASCRAANTHTCVHAALLAHTRLPGLCGVAHTSWMGQRGVGTRKRPARRGRCGPEAGPRRGCAGNGGTRHVGRQRRRGGCSAAS
jgi:hypothetical protein